MSGGQDTNEYEKVPGSETLQKVASKAINKVMVEKGGPASIMDFESLHPVSQVEEQVNHPSHYNQGNIEVIDFIDDQEHLKYNRLQALRYICRSGSKSSESKEISIKKAIWYLERELGMHRKQIIGCDCD